MLNHYTYGGGISSIIVFIFGFFICLFIEDAKVILNKYHIYTILFWICFLISTLFSPYITIKRDMLTFLIAITFFILATSINYNDKEIKYIIYSYIFISLISALNIIWNVIRNHTVTYKRYSTSFFGVDKDPNYASAYIVPAVFILFYLLIKKKANLRYKLVLFIILFIISLGIISTGSRAAFLFIVLSYFINIVFFIFHKKKHRIFKIFTLTILLCLLCIAIRFLVPSDLLSRVTNLSNYKNDSRLVLWLETLKLFIKYPLLGVGLNGANSYLTSQGYHHSHNVYIDILSGSGIIGFLLYILILFNILNVKKSDKAFIFGYMLTSLGPLFFINGFNAPVFWIPMLISGIIHKHSWNSDRKFEEIL